MQVGGSQELGGSKASLSTLGTNTTTGRRRERRKSDSASIIPDTQVHTLFKFCTQVVQLNCRRRRQAVQLRRTLAELVAGRRILTNYSAILPAYKPLQSSSRRSSVTRTYSSGAPLSASRESRLGQRDFALLRKFLRRTSGLVRLTR